METKSITHVSLQEIDVWCEEIAARAKGKQCSSIMAMNEDSILGAFLISKRSGLPLVTKPDDETFKFANDSLSNVDADGFFVFYEYDNYGSTGVAKSAKVYINEEFIESHGELGYNRYIMPWENK